MDSTASSSGVVLSFDGGYGNLPIGGHWFSPSAVAGSPK